MEPHHYDGSRSTGRTVLEGGSSQRSSRARETWSRPRDCSILHDVFYRRGRPLRLHYGFERLRPITLVAVVTKGIAARAMELIPRTTLAAMQTGPVLVLVQRNEPRGSQQLCTRPTNDVPLYPAKGAVCKGWAQRGVNHHSLGSSCSSL